MDFKEIIKTVLLFLTILVCFLFMVACLTTCGFAFGYGFRLGVGA